jgi:MFS family permease
VRLKILQPPQLHFDKGVKRPRSDVATVFLRWTFMRAVSHRGYVLVAFLYFVVDAHLSASQLTFLGTVMSLTLSLSDIPAGAWADVISRRWSLVIGHALLAAGMTMTGFVTGYPWIIATQALWGLGWAFSEGADVAWLTDECDRTESVGRVLAASARLRSAGGAIGVLAFGILGWAIGLARAITISGVGIALLGVQVAVRFREAELRSRSQSTADVLAVSPTAGTRACIARS